MKHIHNQGHAFRHGLSAPFIFSVIVPVVIADFWIEVYHRVCFPLYGLETIERKKYIKVDRHKLEYLSPVQKIFCAYCGYVNGAFQYWKAIGGRTEEYWCGVQHQKSFDFNSPQHHQDFAEYDDVEEFKRKYHSYEGEKPK
ncbi:hypothetical protein KKC60_00070 [Patescibacteria group bacterium]|nr:hypothetical protein [Patescibacteria group bacterium]